MHLFKLVSAALLATAFTAATALAQESATLKKAKDTGVLTLGHRESSIPFSYYNDAKEPIGYSIDFANLVLERIRKQVNAPDLKVRWLPITSGGIGLPSSSARRGL